MPLLQRIGLNPAGANWLDIGCGQGDLLKWGVARFSHAAGCDLSTRMLEGCAGLDVRAQTDPARLPFAGAEFDLVTAVCVYHHVQPGDRARLTADLVRVLKPGGIACMIEHNPLNPVTQTIVRRTPVDADAQLLTAGAARRLLSVAGLIDPRTEYFLYLPEKLYRRFGFLEKWLSGVAAGGQYAVFARKAGGQ